MNYDEELNTRHKIEIIGWGGEEMELLIERYGGHDNLSIWYGDEELYGIHFASSFISTFSKGSRTLNIKKATKEYVRIRIEVKDAGKERE